MKRPTAIIAEDEPVLRARAARARSRRNGRSSTCAPKSATDPRPCSAIDAHAPTVLFLDIEMPGVTGLEVARQASGRCHVVFVTAYDKYAVAAFEQGAVDYVMKPFSDARLEATVERLKSRLAAPPADLDGIAEDARHEPRASARSTCAGSPRRTGDTLRLITVDEICYFKADHKYTLVVTPDSEALIRRPLKSLAEEVDPQAFWQIHRSAMVNVKEIAGVDPRLRAGISRSGSSSARKRCRWARTTCTCSSRCRSRAPASGRAPVRAQADALLGLRQRKRVARHELGVRPAH